MLLRQICSIILNAQLLRVDANREGEAYNAFIMPHQIYQYNMYIIIIRAQILRGGADGAGGADNVLM